MRLFGGWEIVIGNVKLGVGYVNSGLRKGVYLIEGKGVEWRREIRFNGSYSWY